MKNIRKKVHLSNEGFSLMELIITMLVSAIVTAAAAGFLVAGVQFYNRANAETVVQTESQVAELFITELIQESVDYKVISPCPTGASYALEIKQRDSSGNDVTSLVVWTDRQLWYATVPNTITDDVAKVEEVLDKAKSEAFLADCITDFWVYPGVRNDAANGNGLVQLNMEFEEGNKTYKGGATISLRNKKKN